ncbi:MAG: hypothetical protein ABSF26_07360 [Thermoguttaceae bacterium]
MTAANSELRLAIIPTPRSGNVWLRLLLGDLLELQTMAVHDPGDCPWRDLPPRFLLAVHWHRTPAFEELLAWHRFRIVGIHRHPLDTLISILHFSRHGVETHRWLSGEGGNEDGIVGAMPLSRAFCDYAVSRRPGALLNINLEWFDHPARYNVCYERLVAQTGSTLTELLGWLGEAPRRNVGDVIAGRSLAANKKTFSESHHFWKGQPGLWRSLLCRPQAESFAQTHWQSFTRFGYVCDPDPELTVPQADANWIDLLREDRRQLASESASLRTELARTRAEIASLRGQVDRLTEENRELAESLRASGQLLEADEAEKGDSPHLPERPEGCFAQMGTVPFFRPRRLSDAA